MSWLKRLFAKWFPVNDDLPNKNYYHIWRACKYLGRRYYKVGVNDCSNIAGHMSSELYKLDPYFDQCVVVLKDVSGFRPDHAVVFIHRHGFYDPTNRQYIKTKKALSTMMVDPNFRLWKTYKIKHLMEAKNLYKKANKQYQLNQYHLDKYLKKWESYR